MYPITGGFSVAERRIVSLQNDGHSAEALLTSVFTFEKSVRRGLRYLALARGFPSKHADLLFARYGFEQLKQVWPCFDKDGRILSEFVGQNWQNAAKANSMRNKIVHGARVYKLQECDAEAGKVLQAVRDFRAKFQSETAIDVWKKLPNRIVSRTVWDTNWHQPQS